MVTNVTTVTYVANVTLVANVTNVTRMKTFDRVYQVVRTIPAGRVMAYGEVGKLAGTTGRVVGFALHVNPYGEKTGNLYVPCHRVVDRNGRLAPHFAFGGSEEQRMRLLSEGVRFKDKNHVIFA